MTCFWSYPAISALCYLKMISSGIAKICVNFRANSSKNWVGASRRMGDSFSMLMWMTFAS